MRLLTPSPVILLVVPWIMHQIASDNEWQDTISKRPLRVDPKFGKITPESDQSFIEKDFHLKDRIRSQMHSLDEYCDDSVSIINIPWLAKRTELTIRCLNFVMYVAVTIENFC
jgi:hypothetical protein